MTNGSVQKGKSYTCQSTSYSAALFYY